MKTWIIITSSVLVGCGTAAQQEPGQSIDGSAQFVTSDSELSVDWDTEDSLGDDGRSPTQDTATVADVSTAVPDAAADAPPSTPDVAPTLPDAAPSAPDAEPPVPYDPCAVENLDVDTDGDGLSDCDELSDDLPSTDPTLFNGLTATIGVPPEGFLSSAQCGLFFGTDYGELDQHFGPSGQSMSIRSGWEYSAGNTAEYGDANNFDFEPNWEHSDNVGVWDSFQVLYTGWLHLDQAGEYCFSIDTGAGGFGSGDIAGRRNNCGLFYTNPLPAAGPLAETGYGSNESPHTGCGDYDTGWHQLAIAVRHYETYFYAPKLAIRWCYGADADCTPDMALEQHQMRSDAEPVPLPDVIAVDPGGEPDAGSDEPDAVGSPDVTVEDTEPGPTVTEGACTNASDSEIVDALGAEGLQAGITECGMPCFLSGDKQQCITDCVSSDLGLSAECAECYAVPAACAMANCISECMDGGDDCDQCMVDYGCQDDFSACSGLDG